MDDEPDVEYWVRKLRQKHAAILKHRQEAENQEKAEEEKRDQKDEARQTG